MQLTKRKRGRIAKFSLSNIKEVGPIKAVGYTKKFPYQYANYWNKNNDVQVEVAVDPQGNPWFRLKQTP